MKVYTANFGRGNYEWPICLERGTIATMMFKDSFPFYVAKDREGFINWVIANRKTARGITPTKPVASRWYGAMETVENSFDDIWFHRAERKLWWTKSTDGAPEWEVKPSGDGVLVQTCHKPCLPWSSRSKTGTPLEWDGLHPKAREFLFTESTLQRLSEDNAEYALALIEGEDLSRWHLSPNWKAKENKSGKGSVVFFNARQMTICRMAGTVKNTVNNSYGQTVERTVKNKELRFTDEQLETYVDELLEEQEGLCAITGFPLQYDKEIIDPEFACSLDRIDSDGHYEQGNLQVVCKFINRWKSDDSDSEFRRLINLVKSHEL